MFLLFHTIKVNTHDGGENCGWGTIKILTYTAKKFQDIVILQIELYVLLEPLINVGQDKDCRGLFTISDFHEPLHRNSLNHATN